MESLISDYVIMWSNEGEWFCTSCRENEKDRFPLTLKQTRNGNALLTLKFIKARKCLLHSFMVYGIN